MRPAKGVDLNKVKLPAYASPKLDGIRCLVIGGKSYTRTLKQIPNRHIRRQLARLTGSFDGEIIVRDKKGRIAPFDVIQSAVMSQDGEPVFEYHVFDIACDHPQLTSLPFSKRLSITKNNVRSAHVLSGIGFIEFLKHELIETHSELKAYEERCVAQRYEGIMVRSVNGPYKYGVSTLREGYLIKFKRWHDDEATIIGFKERMLNENEQETNELGYAKRSKKKVGMVPAGDLGSWVCIDKKGRQFDVGSGMTAMQRIAFWKKPSQYVGRFVTFKYQELTKDGAPRFPIFKAIRDRRDIV